MYIEYESRREQKRQNELKPVLERKELKKFKQIIAKGGTMKNGRWLERKPMRKYDE